MATIGGKAYYQRTTHATHFRVGGVPVLLRDNNPFSVQDGDQVVLCGIEKQGTVEVVAANNLTAGNFIRRPMAPLFWVPIGWIVVGVPCSLALIGLPVVAFGVYGLMQYKKTKACQDRLEEHLRARPAQPVTGPRPTKHGCQILRRGLQRLDAMVASAILDHEAGP